MSALKTTSTGVAKLNWPPSCRSERNPIAVIRLAVSSHMRHSHSHSTPSAWDIIKTSPGLEDIWQDHYSEAGTKETNPPDDFIANLEGPADAGKPIKLSAEKNGAFTVTNTRNGFSRNYKPR